MQKIVLLAALLAISLQLPAQDDYRAYREKADIASTFFRGRQAVIYPFVFNGTYYWESSQFRKGDIRYNGKLYYDVMLNINAARQELEAKSPNGVFNVLLNSGCVEWFVIDGVKYVNPSFYGWEGAPGYWQVLYDGKARVLRQVVKTLDRDLEGYYGAQLRFNDPNYRADAQYLFVGSEKYCIVAEDGTVTPLPRRSAFLKLYKPYKKSIKRHISGLEERKTLSLGEFLTEAVEYVEGLEK